jgi:hypothetical protein
MIEIKFSAETAGALNLLICQYVGQLTVQTGAYTGAVREALQSAPDIAVNVDTKKPKKRAEKAPVAAQEAFDDEVEEDAAPQAASLSAKELLELKTHTMAALQAAFASGKVNKLRTLLEEHGGGAKSFPEVAAEQFPAISEAIKHGALNDA